MALKKRHIEYKFKIYSSGGDGAFLCIQKVSEEIYEYFQKRKLSIKDYALDSNYAKKKKISPHMQPFDPGSRAEFGHSKCGMTISNNLEITIETEEFNEIFSGKITKQSIKKDNKSFDLIDDYEKGLYLVGYVGLEDCYIEGEINLNSEFDVKKLRIYYAVTDYELSSRKFITSITYDELQIDWWIGDYESTGDHDFDFINIQ